MFGHRIGLVWTALVALSTTGCVTNAGAPTEMPQPLQSLAPPTGSTAVLEASGGGTFEDVKTKAVSVGSAWLIAYAFDCSAQRTTGLFFVKVAATSDRAPSPPPDSWPRSQQERSTGVDYFRVPGTFTLTISTLCAWRVTMATCAGNCGHETVHDGVFERSGIDGVSTRGIPVAAEMQVAYQVDCSGRGGGGVRIDSFRVGIPYATDPASLNEQVAFTGLADAGVSYFHNLAPRDDLLVIRSDCPWSIRIGPRGRVAPFVNPAPHPRVQLPPDPAAKTLLVNASGIADIATDSFTATGSVDVVWAYECSRYSSVQSFTVTMSPADTTSPPLDEPYVVAKTKMRVASGVVHVSARGNYYLGPLALSSCPWSIEVRR